MRGGRGLVARARSARAVRGYVVFIAAFAVLFLADGSRQPTSGPGWRILGYQRGVAGPSQAAVIGTQAALDAAWDRMLIGRLRLSCPPTRRHSGSPRRGPLGVPRTSPASAKMDVDRRRLHACAHVRLRRAQSPRFVPLGRRSHPASRGAYRFVRLGPDGHRPKRGDCAVTAVADDLHRPRPRSHRDGVGCPRGSTASARARSRQCWPHRASCSSPDRPPADDRRDRVQLLPDRAEHARHGALRGSAQLRRASACRHRVPRNAAVQRGLRRRRHPDRRSGRTGPPCSSIPSAGLAGCSPCC